MDDLERLLAKFEGDNAKRWSPEARRLAAAAKRMREGLIRIEAHGCCVMHNDAGCPGCTAKETRTDAIKIAGGSA
jgi:hypothetical protein